MASVAVTTDRIKQTILNILQPLSDMGYLTTDAYMATLTALPSMKSGLVAAFALTSILHESSIAAHNKVQAEALRSHTPATIQQSMAVVLAASYVLNTLSSALNDLLKLEDNEAPVRRDGCELWGGFDLQRLKDFGKMLEVKSKEAAKVMTVLERENEKMQKLVMERLEGSSGKAEKYALELIKGQMAQQQAAQMKGF